MTEKTEAKTPAKKEDEAPQTNLANLWALNNSLSMAPGAIGLAGNPTRPGPNTWLRPVELAAQNTGQIVPGQPSQRAVPGNPNTPGATPTPGTTGTSNAGSGTPAGGQQTQAQQAQTMEADWLANQGLANIPGLDMSQVYNWALSEVQSGVTDPNQVAMDAQNSAWFQQRFPGIAMMQKAGLPPLNVSQYLQYESDVEAAMKMGGLPANTLSTQQIAQAMAQGVSTGQIENQVTDALQNVQAAAQTNPDTYDLLQKWYGVSKGGVAAWLLTGDMGTIQQQTQAVQLGASAENAGFTNLSQAQMYAAVGSGGPGEAQAVQDINKASGLMALTASGQPSNLQGGHVSTETLLESELGVAAPGEITTGEAQRQEGVAVGTRIRAFGGGGGYAGGEPGEAGGTTGLGQTGAS